MERASHPAAIWVCTMLILALAAVMPVPSLAQLQRKSTSKPAAQTPSEPKEDPLAPLLQRAKDAMDKNDFSNAIEPLQKYTAERPDDPFAHFQLGYAYAGLKRWEDAKAEFSRSIALDPRMAPAHLNLGLVLMDSDPAAAAEAFLHAADLQPVESRPRYLTGYAYEHAGNFPLAIDQYRAALAISPKDYECHFALGRVLLRTGDAVAAEEQFHEAIMERSDSAPARLGFANALLAQKKYDAGADALEEYLKLNPSDRAEHFELASTLMDLDRFDDALAELDRSEAGSAPTADGLKTRVDIFMHQNKWKEAAVTLVEAIRQSPQDQQLPEWLGHAEIELHDYRAAIDILGKVVTSNPRDADALRDLVNAFFLNEDYPATLGAMDHLAKLETPKPASWFVRAICYDKLSKKAEAIEAYQKFLDLDNGQNETQDFQARRRAYTLQSELGQAPKRQKH